MDEIYIPLERFIGHPLEQKVKDNIRPKEKDGMYLYRYSDKVIVPRNHPVLVKCRGLILDKDGRVLNYPFDRFFNPHEKESTDIDWETAQIQEKVDGSLICVFYYNDQWQVTTRGSFYPNPLADSDFSLLFKEYFDAFDKLTRNFCYMFELVTDRNRIVTWYEESFVVLLGVRNLETLIEVPYIVVDRVAIELQVRRPRLYEAKNLEECRKLFSGLKDDEEGFVAVDLNSNRIKLKQDSYLTLSNIKMLKDNDILDYVRGLTELDSELLQKDEEILARTNQIRSEWDAFLGILEMVFGGLNKDTRKEFALEAITYPFRKFLFQKLDGREVRVVKLSYDELNAWVYPPGVQTLATRTNQDE